METVTRTMSKVSEKTIEEIAREAIPQICVLGVGGAGCNIISWMKEKGVIGARIHALNTDAKHLGITRADTRILLGYQTCGGLGTGGFSEQGAKAAEESSGEIQKVIAGSGLVFITAGLGGGTGTGASPVIARMAKDLGALTIGVVTIPFQVERSRMEKAKEGLARLVEQCDAVVVIDNTRLRKFAGALPLTEAFAVANEMIANFIKNISETIAIPSLVNLDFADLKAIMTGAKICAVGIGEGQGDNKVEQAVEKALNSQLLDIGDIKRSEGGLIHLEGGDDMTLEDVTKAGEIVINKISPEAKVSWGARVNSAMQGTMRATIVLAGVQSPFLETAVPPASLGVPTGPAFESEVKKPEQPKKKGLFSF